MGNPAGNSPLETHRRRKEDNIKMNFKGTESYYVQWIHLAHKKQVTGPCEIGKEFSDSMKCSYFLTSGEPVTFS
jgi:hypothetical protein